MKQLNSPVEESKKRVPPDYGRILFLGFIATTLAVMMAIPAAAAPATIWEKASDVLKDVYTQVLSISTIAAVATATISLLLMYFSKNERTVSESRTWLKRIIIAYVLINSMGFIMAYITPFLTGGKYVI